MRVLIRRTAVIAQALCIQELGCGAVVKFSVFITPTLRQEVIRALARTTRRSAHDGRVHLRGLY